MSSFPCLVRLVSGSGQVRYRLGERLVDRYLEFVAGRCRPNTLRAVAFDLKAFFMVIGKDPVEVTAADVFDFLADQRGDRTVIRLADRESGAVGADDRTPPVVGLGPVCVPGRPGRYAGSGEPGAARPDDAAAGQVCAVADGAAGTSATGEAGSVVIGVKTPLAVRPDGYEQAGGGEDRGGAFGPGGGEFAG